jgi:alpha-L-rhamnosidase
LCQVLADNGRLDVAYDLLTQKTIPSWLYAVTKGATTIWETWEGIDEAGNPHASLNHYSPGAVVNFLHRTVAGIRADAPGYRRIRIHPQVGGGLTAAGATYESVHGLIASRWVIEGGVMQLDLTLPPNTTATVQLPGARLEGVRERGMALAAAEGVARAAQVGADVVVEVGSGEYRFVYPA